MRACRALARDALAAPSRLFRRFNERFFQAGRRASVNFRLFGPSRSRWPSVDAKYTTALLRLRQHLFFVREHHARLKHSARRVVNADRQQPPAPFEQKHVGGVLPRARLFARAYRRAVTRPARLVTR